MGCIHMKRRSENLTTKAGIRPLSEWAGAPQRAEAERRAAGPGGQPCGGPCSASALAAAAGAAAALRCAPAPDHVPFRVGQDALLPLYALASILAVH